MTHDAVHILAADGVVDRRGAAIAHDLEHHFGGVFRRWLHAGLDGQLGEILAGHGRFPAIAGDEHIGRVAAAAVGEDALDHFVLDRLPGLHAVDPAHQGVVAAFLGPLRDQRVDAGLRGGVGVLVDCDIDSPGPGFIHQPQGVHRIAPVGGADDLVMGDLHRDAGLLADADRLVDRLDHQRGLVAQVGDVDAAVLRRHPRQLDHLLGGGEAAGHIEQAGGDAERPLFHGLGDHGLHPLEFGRGRVAVLDADHLRAHRALADENRPVRADAQFLDFAVVVGDGPGGGAVVALGQRGYALQQRAVGGGHIEDALQGVGVGVDEARGDYQAAGVDPGFRAGIGQVADGGDAVAANADIGLEPGVAAAVDDAASADQDIELLGVGRAAGKQQRDGD